MKLTIKKGDLYNHLQDAGKIISSKPIVPILSCFLFELKNGTMFITAASEDGHIKTSVDYFGDMGEISFCLESKMLLNFLKILPEQPLEFTVEENLSVCVKYSAGKFQMMAKETATFPGAEKKEPLGEIRITCKQFLNGLAKTQFCSCDDDELRPIMNAVYVEVSEGSMNYVGSDTHRLSLLSHPIADTPRISFALPKKIASILKAIVPSTDDEIILRPSGTDVTCIFKEYQVVARLLEGKYPNYRSVIPKSNDKILLVETAILKNALSRVAVFANQASHLVRFALHNYTLTLYAQDLDYSIHAEEKVDCEYDGTNLNIGLSHALLIEMLAIIPSEKCIMSFSDASRPVLLMPEKNNEGEELTCLLMPLMLA